MNLMMILRQLWNQRAANGWILGELVVVTYFLWGVVDPVLCTYYCPTRHCPTITTSLILTC